MSEAPETEVEVIAPEPVDEADATPTPEQIEAEAIEMGWKPKSGFRGDDAKFVDAAEYVRRGKEIMPFLRKDLASAYKKIEALEGAVARSVEHISKAEKQAYERAKKELENQLEQQASVGDTAGVKATAEEIVALEREVIAQPPAAASNPEFETWQAENTWFGKDKPLTAATIEIGNEVLAEGFTGKAQIKEVDRRVREAFPSKFTNPNRAGAAAVEGLGSAARKTGKSYSDLPPEARAMCDDFVKSIKGFSKEKYVKEYFAS